MGIFGGFRAKFSKDSSRKNQKKGEVGVVCTSYRVFSEFSDDYYTRPNHNNEPKPSSSGAQSSSDRNDLKPLAPILKTPSSSSTLQESAVEIVTIRKDKNISVNRIKARSQTELSTFQSEPPKSKRVQSADDLTNINLPLPPPRPPAEKKPTPKARKGVDKLAENDSNINGPDDVPSYKYPSYNSLTHPSQGGINLKIQTDDNYIEPVNSQVIKYNTEGIYEEPVFNGSELATLQNSEGTFLQSRAKKVRKEKGKKREAPVLQKATHSIDNDSETSTVGVLKEEKITVSGINHKSVTSSISVESVEVNSTGAKTESQSKNDYGSYFNQKATSFGLSTSQAASIFFQADDDDDDEDEHKNQENNDKNDNNRDSSWKGVRITELTADDDQNRRVSADC